MRNVRESRRKQMERRRLVRERQFSLMSIREAQRMVVRACGRLVLGHGAHEPLWALLVDEANGSDVALDLSCVNDIDARGLGVLADLARRAGKRGTRLSVLAASGVVQRIGELTRLDRMLPGAWHRRSGVLRCRSAHGDAIAPAAAREFGSRGCDGSPAAA